MQLVLFLIREELKEAAEAQSSVRWTPSVHPCVHLFLLEFGLFCVEAFLSGCFGPYGVLLRLFSNQDGIKRHIHIFKMPSVDVRAEADDRWD